MAKPTLHDLERAKELELIRSHPEGIRLLSSIPGKDKPKAKPAVVLTLFDSCQEKPIVCTHHPLDIGCDQCSLFPGSSAPYESKD